ncbi:uncharacterized protein LOC111859703 isoform X1 [Arapaima gigas]
MLHDKNWMLWILLCCSLPSLNGQHGCTRPCEKNITVTGYLNAAVLLPCTFTVGSMEQMIVVWSQSTDLVTLYEMEQIRFSDNRKGRLKVFPHMSSIGNFSIQLESLQLSDQGSYCCGILNKSICSTVNVQLQKPDSDSKPGQETTLRGFMVDNWYFVAAGGAVFVILVIAYICCVKHKSLHESTQSDYVNENYSKDYSLQHAESTNRGESSGEQERDTTNHTAPDTEYEQGDGSYDETGIVPDPVTIYENNEHDPSWTCVNSHPFFQEGPTCSGSTQQQDLQNSYYANQSEIANEAGTRMKIQNKRSFWRRKNKQQSLECENPIYAKKPEQILRR